MAEINVLDRKTVFFVVRIFYLVKHPVWLVADSDNVINVLISHLNDAKLNSKENLKKKLTDVLLRVWLLGFS